MLKIVSTEQYAGVRQSIDTTVEDGAGSKSTLKSGDNLNVEIETMTLSDSGRLTIAFKKDGVSTDISIFPPRDDASETVKTMASIKVQSFIDALGVRNQLTGSYPNYYPLFEAMVNLTNGKLAGKLFDISLLYNPKNFLNMVVYKPWIRVAGDTSIEFTYNEKDQLEKHSPDAVKAYKEKAEAWKNGSTSSSSGKLEAIDHSKTVTAPAQTQAAAPPAAAPKAAAPQAPAPVQNELDKSLELGEPAAAPFSSTAEEAFSLD